MNLYSTLRTALRALRSNIGRSLLTILGIVIGIVAIVLVISLGQGARELVLGQIEGIGGNILIVRPGREPQGPSDFADAVLVDSLKDRDIAALLRPENVPGVEAVAPALLVSGSLTHQEEIYRPVMFGWTAQAMVDFFNIYPAEGDYFTQDETAGESGGVGEQGEGRIIWRLGSDWGICEKPRAEFARGGCFPADWAAFAV
jgi:putative ABC transport system permease protein